MAERMTNGRLAMLRGAATAYDNGLSARAARELLDETERARTEEREVLALLWHEAQRNHNRDPRGCTPCENVAKALERYAELCRRG